jgi:hypothetical protein
MQSRANCHTRSRSTAIRRRIAGRQRLPANEGNQCKIRSSKYGDTLIEQDHRSIKLSGLVRCSASSIFEQPTIAGIELMHRIRKGQFKLDTLRVRHKTAPEIWNAGLGA